MSTFLQRFSNPSATVNRVIVDSLVAEPVKTVAEAQQAVVVSLVAEKDAMVDCLVADKEAVEKVIVEVAKEIQQTVLPDLPQHIDETAGVVKASLSLRTLHRQQQKLEEENARLEQRNKLWEEYFAKQVLINQRCNVGGRMISVSLKISRNDKLVVHCRVADEAEPHIKASAKFSDVAVAFNTAVFNLCEQLREREKDVGCITYPLSIPAAWYFPQDLLKTWREANRELHVSIFIAKQMEEKAFLAVTKEWKWDWLEGEGYSYCVQQSGNLKIRYRYLVSGQGGELTSKKVRTHCKNFNPHFVMMIGSCAGNRAKTKLFDVVVPTKMVKIVPKSINDQGLDWTVDTFQLAQQSGEVLTTRIENFKYKPVPESGIRNLLSENWKPDFGIRTENPILLVSPAVVENLTTTEAWRQMEQKVSQPNLCAIEMETGGIVDGVAQAYFEHKTRKTDVMVIKGVMDFGSQQERADRTIKDLNQFTATANATLWFLQFMNKNIQFFLQLKFNETN